MDEMETKFVLSAQISGTLNKMFLSYSIIFQNVISKY